MSKKTPKIKHTLHIYCRVSSESQRDEGTSLEEQKRRGIQTAKSRGMNHYLWEEGSASSHYEGFENRPVFSQVLDHIRKGEIRHLFVSNLDRLSRNKKNSTLIEWELHNNKVTLHTPAGEYELGNPQNDLMFSVLTAFSTFDNQQRMERFRLGRFNKVSQGQWHGGAAPFGYRLEDKRLVVDEKQASWVIKMFEMYSEGKSNREIQNELTVNGVKTNRGKDIWSLGSIDALLKNTHYAGFYKVTDHRDDPPKEYTIESPRIIPDELFFKVLGQREKRKKKRTRNSNEKNFYLLKNLLVCGHCGRNFHGRIQQLQYSNYYCPAKERRGTTSKTHNIECQNNRYLRLEETDRLVWEQVIDVLSTSHQYKESVKRVVLGKPKSTPEQDEQKRELITNKKHIENQLRDLKKSLIDLDSKIMIGEGDIEHFKGVRENVTNFVTSKTTELENIAFQIDDLEKSTRWVDWVSKFGEDLSKKSGKSPEEKQDFLESILENIEVTTIDSHTHGLKLNFRIPYVDDELIYNDPENKRKGYKIGQGRKDFEMRIDSSKKIYNTVT